MECGTEKAAGLNRGVREMARIKLVDTNEKFSLEIDGTEIPYVTTYTITKTVRGYLTMQINLSVDEVEEIVIDSDHDVDIRKEAVKIGRKK